jgi:hypothetical protein
VVGLVDDDHVIARSFQLVKHALLFQQVDRGQAERDMLERIRPELHAAPHLLKTSTVDYLQPQAKALGHLEPPLLQQRTGGGDDEDAVCHAPRHELGYHEAGLYRLPRPTPSPRRSRTRLV